MADVGFIMPDGTSRIDPEWLEENLAEALRHTYGFIRPEHADAVMFAFVAGAGLVLEQMYRDGTLDARYIGAHH